MNGSHSINPTAMDDGDYACILVAKITQTIIIIPKEFDPPLMRLAPMPIKFV